MSSAPVATAAAPRRSRRSVSHAAPPWKMTAAARITELRGLARAFAVGDPPPHLTAQERDELGTAIEHHLAAAQEAVERPHRLTWRSGAQIERVTANLDDAATGLLRLGPDAYVTGRLPSLRTKARAHLRKNDPQLTDLEQVAKRYAPADGASAPPLTARDRETIASVYDVSCCEARREVARVRSFRNILLVTAAALSLVVAGLTTLTALQPQLLPMCFMPVETAVCPTHTGPTGGAQALLRVAGAPVVARASADGSLTNAQEARRAELDDMVLRRSADPWDVALVELMGIVAAAVAAAFALRTMNGTATPYSLPIALAVLKVPTGALTAVLGIVLLRGQFVPGLTALDTSAQILAWAAAFGAAQQAVTRLVDRQAQGVLDKVGAPGDTKSPDGTRAAGGQPVAASGA
ncbi:MAG TPA: hypothetical protein VNT55_08580, partial [Baekduia sp.]|nr:hypothetical protein [Baekduia sp.]